MSLKSPQEYLQDLRNMNITLYMFGEKVDNYVDHPIIRPSINAMAMTYKLAQEPEYEDLMTTTSNLTGKKINRFNHVHQNPEDLMKKVKMQRLLDKKPDVVFKDVSVWMPLMLFIAQLVKLIWPIIPIIMSGLKSSSGTFRKMIWLWTDV